jgi:hypothetical protein
VARLEEIDERFDTVLILRNNFGLDALDRIAQLTDRLITDSVDPARTERPAGAHRFRVRWLEHASPWFRYLMLSPAELEGMLEGSGWTLGRLIDDGSARYAAVLDRRALS